MPCVFLNNVHALLFAEKGLWLWLAIVCHGHVASYLDCRTQQTHDQVLKKVKGNWKIMDELNSDLSEVEGRRQLLLGSTGRWEKATSGHWFSRSLQGWMDWVPSWVSPHMEDLFIMSDGRTSLRNWAAENSSALHRTKCVKETMIWGWSRSPSYLGNPGFLLFSAVANMVTKHSFLKEYGRVLGIQILYIRRHTFNHIQ